MPVSAPNGGYEPSWGPGAQTLYYRNAVVDMVAASIDLESAAVVSSRRILFSSQDIARNVNLRTYSLSPDGDRFVMVRLRAGTSGELVIVHNFFEELKRLVPN